MQMRDDASERVAPSRWLRVYPAPDQVARRIRRFRLDIEGPSRRELSELCCPRRIGISAREGGEAMARRILAWTALMALCAFAPIAVADDGVFAVGGDGAQLNFAGDVPSSSISSSRTIRTRV